jgi:hypothetical protein
MEKRYIRKDGAIIKARLITSLALRANGKPAIVVNMVEEMDDPHSDQIDPHNTGKAK